MKKTFLPLLLAICLCLVFLSGCTPERAEEETASLPQSSQVESLPETWPIETHPYLGTDGPLTPDDLRGAEQQIPPVIELLTSSIWLKGPINTALHIPQPDILSFINSTLLVNEKEEGPFGKNSRFRWESRTREVPIQDGSDEPQGTYTETYHFLPMESARRIAYEIFGVQKLTSSNYDEEWDGLILPDGIGLKDFNSPGEITLKTDEEGLIAATFDLLPGGMGDSMETSGRFTFYFQAMKEDGNVFVRFLRSEKLENGKAMHVFRCDDKPENEYEQMVADWFSDQFQGKFEESNALLAASVYTGKDAADPAEQKRAYDEGLRTEAYHLYELSTPKTSDCIQDLNEDGTFNHFCVFNLERIVEELELTDYRVVHVWFEQLYSEKKRERAPQNPEGIYRQNFVVGKKAGDKRNYIYVIGMMHREN